MSSCASCGKVLSNDGDECAQCNSEPERDIFLNPRRQKRNFQILKVVIVGLIFGTVVVLTFVGRLPQFRAALGPALLYVLGGLALVILLLRLFVPSTTERL